MIYDSSKPKESIAYRIGKTMKSKFISATFVDKNVYFQARYTKFLKDCSKECLT